MTKYRIPFEGNEAQFLRLVARIIDDPILRHAACQIEDCLDNEEPHTVCLNETSAGDQLPDSLWEM